MQKSQGRPQVSPRLEAIADRLDGIAQAMFTAGLIADVLQRIWERDPHEGQARLAELRLLARDALLDLRGLLDDLRSNGLDEASRDPASDPKEL